MAMDQSGIMALPEASKADVPQLSLDDSYDAVKTALRQASPQASGQVESTLSQISSGIADLTPDQAAEILKILQDLYNSTPEEYKTKLEKYIKDGAMQPGDLPEEYDPEFLATAITLVLEARKTSEAAQNEMLAPPEGFAKGGIASAAKMLASKGRRGDTMLAHINPQEAALLRAHGGSGTINPKTGLPEYNIFSSIWKGITGAVKSVLSNPIGRIIGTIALATVLGPVVGTTLAMPLASAGTTLLSGGSIKDAFTSAAFSYLGGPNGPISNFVSPLTESLTGFGPTTVAGQAITSGIVGTGVGVLSGKSLADSVKAGLIQGAMTYGSGTFAKAPVRDAGPMLPGLNDRMSSLPEAPTLAGSEVAPPALSLDSAQGARALASSIKPIAATGPETSASAVQPQPAAAATQPPAQTAGAPSAAQTAQPVPKVPTITDSLSQIGRGIGLGEGPANLADVKTGLGNLFAPSLSTEQLKQTPEYLEAISKGRTSVEALQQASKAYDPGMMRTYGPAVAAGLGLMGAMGGFKQQPLRLSPEQRRMQDMMTGGPGSAQDLMLRDPGRYFLQYLPGVPYYGQSIYPTKLADGGDVEMVPEMASGGIANIPLMQKHYRQYWENTKPGEAIDWAGGKLTRIDPTSAYYENPTTGEKILLNPKMDMGYITSQSPSIAKEWATNYNFNPVPQGSKGTVNDMADAYKSYWEKGPNEMDWAGGKLVKAEDNKSATYTGPGGQTVTLTPSSDLDAIARSNPDIAAAWKTEFGYQVDKPATTGTQIASDYSTVGVEQPTAGVPNASNPYVEQMLRSQAAARQAFAPPPIPSAAPPVPPTAMMGGGIASLMEGGYPRRTGQISGPGTEKSDSIPAMLSDGEFVMTAKAVRGAGNGSRRDGAKKMYKLMHQLERNANRG